MRDLSAALTHAGFARLTAGIAIGLGGAVLLNSPSNAIDTLQMQIAQLRQGGISARGIHIELQLPSATRMPARIRVDEVQLPEIGLIRNLVIECAQPIAHDYIYRCDDAHVTGNSVRFGPQDFRTRAQWDDRSRALQFQATGIRAAGGTLALQGQWNEQQWSMHMSATTLGLAQLQQSLGPLMPALPGWNIDGQIKHISAQFSGAASVTKLQASVDFKGVSVGNSDGTIATDQLAARLQVQAARHLKSWRIDAQLHSGHGEALAGRWYWNFTQQPLTSEWHVELDDDGVLALEQGRWQLGAFMRAAASGEIDTSAKPLLRRLEVSVDSLDVAALPPQTRDGLLAASPVSQLQGAGKISGRMQFQDDAPTAIDLHFDSLRLDDSNAKLGIDGLSGRLLWHNLERRKQALAADDKDVQSQLAWKSGLLYGVRIGAAQLSFNTASGDVKLIQPARIPILDGGLDIRILQLRRIGDPAMAIRFDATLDPISIGLLCKAFDWPEFAGTLSGHIPELNLEAGVLTLGGALQAAVFDGALTVKDLRLSDAFGARPRLTANVDFSRLDLAAVTSAFSVGRITGRLDGRLDRLELVGWEPIAFDARLYSTPGDRSRKRISQRAVENISSLGGGGGTAAALQRSALRFFNEFNYDRLGISCRLHNDVCDMDGVAAHAPGYYIVKGWGLPRIDVIGNLRRVDWPRLLATLKQLPESQATVGNSP